MPKWDVNLAASSQFQIKICAPLNQPFGFSTDVSAPAIEQPRKREMLQAKLMQVATASKMQIFSILLMSWMMGNNISIFLLLALGQSIFSSVSGFLNFSKVFEPYEGMLPSLNMYKAIYLTLHLVLLGILGYKLSSVGLIPVSAPDYIGLTHSFQQTAMVFKA